MEYFLSLRGFSLNTVCTSDTFVFPFINGFASIHHDTEFAGFQQLEQKSMDWVSCWIDIDSMNQIHSSGGDVKEHLLGSIRSWIEFSLAEREIHKL